MGTHGLRCCCCYSGMRVSLCARREAQWGPLNEDGLRACCIIALWLHLIAVLIASETQEL